MSQPLVTIGFFGRSGMPGSAPLMIGETYCGSNCVM